MLEVTLKIAEAASYTTSTIKNIKEMTSEAEAEKNEQAHVRREKIKIEKVLQDCFETNIGQELSQLKVPVACAEFTIKFIRLYGMDEFSKQISIYKGMCKARVKLSENQ
ncbi:MAG: hypothetical protein ACOYT8_00520 [Candidatus Dependentiae bacterium]